MLTDGSGEYQHHVPGESDAEWVASEAFRLAADNSRLRAAIRDTERAILGEHPTEADLRLHESLSPLWQALNDA